MVWIKGSKHFFHVDTQLLQNVIDLFFIIILKLVKITHKIKIPTLAVFCLFPLFTWKGHLPCIQQNPLLLDI
jgi:hypothetical protein